jgi:hypothetical protein
VDGAADAGLVVPDTTSAGSKQAEQFNRRGTSLTIVVVPSHPSYVAVAPHRLMVVHGTVTTRSSRRISQAPGLSCQSATSPAGLVVIFGRKGQVVGPACSVPHPSCSLCVCRL